MKVLASFSPAFTVPNFHQRLTAAHPVRIHTYQFDALGPSGDSPPSLLAGLCDPLHRLPGVHALPPHNHEHHEIGIVTAGAAVHRTADDAVVLRPGSALAVAPGEVHAFERIDGLQIVTCTYLTEWLFYDIRELLLLDGLAWLFFPEAFRSSSQRLRVPQWSISPEMLSACLRELHDLTSERARKPSSVMLMRRTLEKLMLMLHRTFVTSGGSFPAPFQPQIRAALERIEETTSRGDPMDVAGLAKAFGMSPDCFRGNFRQATGRTPTDYIQRRRVQHACCLLLNGHQKITEVALALGYYDAAHFSRLFQRYRGMSPRTFRLKYAADGGEDPTRGEAGPNSRSDR